MICLSMRSLVRSCLSATLVPLGVLGVSRLPETESEVVPVLVAASERAISRSRLCWMALAMASVSDDSEMSSLTIGTTPMKWMIENGQASLKFGLNPLTKRIPSYRAASKQASKSGHKLPTKYGSITTTYLRL